MKPDLKERILSIDSGLMVNVNKRLDELTVLADLEKNERCFQYGKNASIKNTKQ